MKAASELMAVALYISLEKVAEVVVNSAPKTFVEKDLLGFVEDVGNLFMSILKEKVAKRESEKNDQSEPGSAAGK